MAKRIKVTWKLLTREWIDLYKLWRHTFKAEGYECTQRVYTYLDEDIQQIETTELDTMQQRELAEYFDNQVLSSLIKEAVVKE